MSGSEATPRFAAQKMSWQTGAKAGLGRVQLNAQAVIAAQAGWAIANGDLAALAIGSGGVAHDPVAGVSLLKAIHVQLKAEPAVARLAELDLEAVTLFARLAEGGHVGRLGAG